MIRPILIFYSLFCVAIALMGASQPVAAAESNWKHVPGPVPARVVRVIDGDTVLVDAHPWPGHAIRVSVRLRGIDTPERRSHCLSERRAANLARKELERLVRGSKAIELLNIAGGKYYGRVLADLKTNSHDVASAMLESGLAVPYRGGKRRKKTCPAS